MTWSFSDCQKFHITKSLVSTFTDFGKVAWMECDESVISVKFAVEPGSGEDERVTVKSVTIPSTHVSVKKHIVVLGKRLRSSTTSNHSSRRRVCAASLDLYSTCTTKVWIVYKTQLPCNVSPYDNNLLINTFSSGPYASKQLVSGN